MRLERTDDRLVALIVDLDTWFYRPVTPLYVLLVVNLSISV
jgi:hypothetical protein